MFLSARLGVVRDPSPGHEKYEGMLCIPYVLHDSQVVSLRFRCMEEHDHRAHGHGKYMSLPDEPARLYGTEAFFRADSEISVTEGEMDCLILNQAGIPAVGAPGAHAWQPRFRRIFAGFSRVWLWGDPDEAGQEFNNRLMRALPQARPVKLRHGDVNDTYLAEGGDYLKGLIGE